MRLRCRLGWHRWRNVEGYFSVGQKCRDCPKWKNNDSSAEREQKALDHVKAAVGADAPPHIVQTLVLRELLRLNP